MTIATIKKAGRYRKLVPAIFYRGVATGRDCVDRIVLEDGSGYILLENGYEFALQETGYCWNYPYIDDQAHILIGDHW